MPEFILNQSEEKVEPKREFAIAIELSLVGLAAEQKVNVTGPVASATAFGGALAGTSALRDALKVDANSYYRSPYGSWWELHGDRSTRQVFEDQRRYAGNKVLHDSWAHSQAQVWAKQEVVNRSRDHIRQHAQDLHYENLKVWATNQEAAQRMGREADLLTRVIKSPADNALQETQAVLRELGGPENSAVKAALREYEVVAKSGDWGSASGLAAETKLSSLAEQSRTTAMFHRDVAEAHRSWSRGVEVARHIDNFNNADKVRALVGTSAEVRAGAKLVSAESPLGIYIGAHASALEQHAVAEARARTIESAMSANRQVLNGKIAEKFNGVLATGGGRLLGGAALSLTSVAAGYGADQALSEVFELNKPDLQANASARLLLDGALVPSLIMSELPFRVRIPLVAAAFASGRIASCLPESSLLLKTNAVDSFMIPAAVMSPLSARYKSAAIAGSVVFGRVIGAVLDGSSAKKGI